MLLGIPRGFFYYDYLEFTRRLFCGTGVDIVEGAENDEKTLEAGSSRTVDEACLPIKLFAGQVHKLCEVSDRVLIPRTMKDCSGRWLCPKLLGLPEFVGGIEEQEKLLITEPLYFHDEKRLKKALWNMCKKLKVGKDIFRTNFHEAYSHQYAIAANSGKHREAPAWGPAPLQTERGEEVFRNAGKVLVTGHCYNVYDRFANADIIRKLHELGFESITERDACQYERERAVSGLKLAKKPFWEALIRTLGSALCLRNDVAGIIYLSSFSCGPDAVIVELMKLYVPDIPILVLKLDEHRGEAGFETRVEAFADLLERRQVS